LQTGIESAGSIATIINLNIYIMHEFAPLQQRMRSLSIISTILLTSLFQLSTINCSAQWQPTSGPYSGNINCMALQGSNIYAGSGAGVYLSTDNGNSWKPVNNGLVNLIIVALAVSGDSILAGTAEGVFLSIDSGEHWTAVNNGLTGKLISALVINGKNIYAGTYDKGVFLSTDGCASWTLKNNGIIDSLVTSLAVEGDLIIAGTKGGGMFVSQDKGDSWTASNNGLTSLSISKLAIAGKSAFAGTNGGGFFVSADSGKHWTSANSGLSNLAINSILVTNNHIFVGTSNGSLFISSSNGANWSLLAGLGTQTFVISMLDNGTEIFAGTIFKGVFRSPDNGDTWISVNSGIKNAKVIALKASRNNMFAVCAGYNIFRSADEGNTWTDIGTGILSNRICAMAVKDEIIFAGAVYGGVFFSLDNGNTWNAANNGFYNGSIESIITLTVKGDIIFAGTSQGLYASSNNGENWTLVGDLPAEITDLAIIGEKIIVSTNGNGVFLSKNGGIKWTAINSGLKNLKVNVLTINGRYILAGTEGSGIFTSSDCGLNWKESNSGLTNSIINTFERNNSKLYAGTNSGVFSSVDNGQNWTKIVEGLTDTLIFSLEVAGNHLYASTENSVWKLSLSNEPNYNIRGSVTNNTGEPIRGVVMYGLPGNPITDAFGNYADSVSQEWTESVTPVLNGFVFIPESQSYTNIDSDSLNQNYTGAYYSLRSITVNPDSVTLYQAITVTKNSPSFTFIDNSYNNIHSYSATDDQDEIIRHKTGYIIPDSVVEYWKTHQPAALQKSAVSLPSAIDWSNNDSPVKDQGYCGSCWAFAVTAFIENLGLKDDLSEQVLVSCSDAGDCGGGLLSLAMQYFKNTGVPDELCYPYIQKNGNCSFLCLDPSYKERISTVSDELWGIANVEQLKDALQTGPLVVGMKVPEDLTFDRYADGIYNYEGGEIGEGQSHAILLVGYDDDQQCFKAKNSWGSSWGEDGYFRIAYDDVTDDVQFGSYAFTGSGVYSEIITNAVFTLYNHGNDNLVIDTISENKDWLTITGYKGSPVTIPPDDSFDIAVNVNWSKVNTPKQTGLVTIESNDPENQFTIVEVNVIRLTPPIPTINEIIQPDCIDTTGSIIIGNLPDIGPWILKQIPGESITGTGSTYTLQGLSAGKYEFYVTNEAGYTSEARNVTINEPLIPGKPSVGTITQPTCTKATGSILLYNLRSFGSWILTQEPGGKTITGTESFITISGLEPGTYNYTITNSSSCVSEPSDSIIIIRKSKPPQPIVSVNGTVLNSDNPDGNQWYNQTGPIQGATEQDYVVSVSGYYYTIVTLSGCSSDKSNTVNLLITSNALSEGNKPVKVYPNPVSDEIFIEIENNCELINFEILNSYGQVIYRSSLIEKAVLPAGNLPSGIYLLKLENRGIYKFIKD
jgi:C1A family cysteine protease/photosystem II stability/assembly factor-like uncharacterized protein